jgi:hypothetical protein
MSAMQRVGRSQETSFARYSVEALQLVQREVAHYLNSTMIFKSL